jgi:AcrR family transcriptional regulator
MGPPERKRERTRRELLSTALEVFWVNGYNATSIDQVIEASRFTKGAFYYYFPSKRDLAQAVIDDAIGELTQQRWLDPLAESSDPLATLVVLLKRSRDHSTMDHLRRGCPLNNMALEVSAIDDEMRARVQHWFDVWIGGISSALKRSQQDGVLRADIDTVELATFVVAGFEGAISLAKASHSEETLQRALGTLIRYLEDLRTVNNSAATADRTGGKR